MRDIVRSVLDVLVSTPTALNTHPTEGNGHGEILRYPPGRSSHPHVEFIEVMAQEVAALFASRFGSRTHGGLTLPGGFSTLPKGVLGGGRFGAVFPGFRVSWSNTASGRVRF